MKPIEEVENKWYWVSNILERNKWLKLLSYAEEKFSYKKKPYGCIGPGTCLPRKFLEKYSKTKIPEYCNDEVRIPLFSQIFGLKLYDTGFYEKWFDKKGEKYFNARKKEIKKDVIEKELSKPNGRRAFHPYRKIYRF